MTFRRFHKRDAPAPATLAFFKALIACGRERASLPDSPARTAPELLYWVESQAFPWWLILADKELAGCLYITGIEGRRGFVHFAFLPGPDPVKMGRFILSSVLWDRDPGGRFLIDTLVGITPAENKGALSLIERCGAVKVGVIPGFYYNHDKAKNTLATITYCTRDTVPAEWGDNHG